MQWVGREDLETKSKWKKNQNLLKFSSHIYTFSTAMITFSHFFKIIYYACAYVERDFKGNLRERHRLVMNSEGLSGHLAGACKGHSQCEWLIPLLLFILLAVLSSFTSSKGHKENCSRAEGLLKVWV
jgi:hypothetical protein